jgi:hypothetical protein
LNKTEINTKPITKNQIDNTIKFLTDINEEGLITSSEPNLDILQISEILVSFIKNIFQEYEFELD